MKSRYYPIVDDIIDNRIDGEIYVKQLTRDDVIRICGFQQEDTEYNYKESRHAVNIRRLISKFMTGMFVRTTHKLAPDGIYRNDVIEIYGYPVLFLSRVIRR